MDSRDNVPIAVIKVTSRTSWQEDVTAESNECARARFPKCLAVHLKRVGNEAEECVNVGPLHPFPEQAVNEMVASEME